MGDFLYDPDFLHDFLYDPDFLHDFCSLCFSWSVMFLAGHLFAVAAVRGSDGSH